MDGTGCCFKRTKTVLTHGVLCSGNLHYHLVWTPETSGQQVDRSKTGTRYVIFSFETARTILDITVR